MTPPGAPDSDAGPMNPAVSSCPEVKLKPVTVLRKRADFLAAARARRQGTASMMVQARKRGDDDLGMRVGFTCSKKVGNAVARNRAKRRLRAVAHEVLPVSGLNGWDYVLIGRKDVTADRPFEALKGDLLQALKKLHPAS
ncbi:ribonuclease P protein component [Roseovarius gaetbuli]|nr:ribonuclease P protein component [Roseovarius gaetbuli]